MKFIVFKYNKSTERPFDIYTLPDTALHINKRPFFIPDYAKPCLMHIHQAIHICRLGRSISERFAHRYYDKVTLCSRMETPNLIQTIGCCFDECLTVGDWIPIEQIHQKQHINSSLDILAPKAISEISKYFTLRQGDVILLDEVKDVTDLQINNHVEESYYGLQVLNFNIK